MPLHLGKILRYVFGYICIRYIYLVSVFENPGILAQIFGLQIPTQWKVGDLHVQHVAEQEVQQEQQQAS